MRPYDALGLMCDADERTKDRGIRFAASVMTVDDAAALCVVTAGVDLLNEKVVPGVDRILPYL